MAHPAPFPARACRLFRIPRPRTCPSILPRIRMQTSAGAGIYFPSCRWKLYSELLNICSKLLNICSVLLNICSELLNRVFVGTKASISPYLRKFGQASEEVWTGKRAAPTRAPHPLNFPKTSARKPRHTRSSRGISYFCRVETYLTVKTK